jgi:hypothetical protein
MSVEPTTDPSAFDETGYARELIARIVRECPRRVATSPDERRAHELIREELAALGLPTELHSFTWNQSLYLTLALHFGIATAGSLLASRAPLLAFALHALTAGSYAADSARAAFVLRRLAPFGASQNVLARLPAKAGSPRLRVVFLAHADAAYTGIVFHPELLKRLVTKETSPLHKSLRVTTGAVAGLALLDLAQIVTGRSRAISTLRALLTVPPFLAFALNLDVVLRNHVVPGAMDNLSGVAGMLLLARRIRERVPADVEVIFCATGCEEAGLGGATRLARDKRAEWDPERTVVIGLDSLANGSLCWFKEGEIFPAPLAPWLLEALRDTAASEPRFAEVASFNIPVGGTDVVPFARAGYDAVSLGCVDRSRGAPRHYHMPTDAPENLEADSIAFSVDFAERLFDRILARR